MKVTSKEQERGSDLVVYTAELFEDEGCQAVLLPDEFKFSGNHVYICRDSKTGDVILSSKPKDWSTFLCALEQVPASEKEGFLEDLARD